MPKNYDFGGWATIANVKCSDGRTIMHNAFKDNDGKRVPLCWGHLHDDPCFTLGHADLEQRDKGMYAYCTFNGSEMAEQAKELVRHGDVLSLSIWANQLRQDSARNVMHGDIKEVSLVLAGANPKAFIDEVLVHGELTDEEAIIGTGENPDFSFDIVHADKEEDEKKLMADDEKMKKSEEEPEEKPEKKETIKDVFNTLTDKQKKVVYAIVGAVVNQEREKEKDDESEEEDDDTMKHNVFDTDEREEDMVISHSDQGEILKLAKSSGVGSFKEALNIYMDDNDFLAHGFDPDTIDTLFPDYKNLQPGAPEIIPENDEWVSIIMNKVGKIPFSRVRTRQADVSAIRAKGYKTKGSQKANIGNITMVSRTTDPQTIYIKDDLHRDDVVDIVDFDAVAYEQGIMKNALNEEIATAVMIGDGREAVADDKISEDHIRSIWNDDELYTHHVDVDVAGTTAELQGTNTAANFGTDFIYTEAIVKAVHNARRNYKGKGNPDAFFNPDVITHMLMARDMNGRRIYDSLDDLAKVLRVGKIYEVESFDNKTRTTDDTEPKTKKLLGIIVNMNDYKLGATKGGQVSNFSDFDIDFNKLKFMIETRLSGALTRVGAAIALEEDVTASKP